MKNIANILSENLTFRSEDVKYPGQLTNKLNALVGTLKYVEKRAPGKAIRSTGKISGLYYGANSTNNGYFLPLHICPKPLRGISDYSSSKRGGEFYVKFKVTATATKYANYVQTAIVLMWFNGKGELSSYHIQNNFSEAYLISRIAYTKPATSAIWFGEGDCEEISGTWIGVGITIGSNYNVQSYARDITIDVLDISSDTLHFDWETDELSKQWTLTSWYAEATALKTAGKISAVHTVAEIAVLSQGLLETGDANDNTTLTDYYTSMHLTPINLPLKQYLLCGLGKEDSEYGYGTVLPLASSDSTNLIQSRNYNESGFDWNRGLYTYRSSTTINANTTNTITLYSSYKTNAMDLRQSDNCIATTSKNTLNLLYGSAVYLRGIIKNDNLFYLKPFTVTYNSKTYTRVWIQEYEILDKLQNLTYPTSADNTAGTLNNYYDLSTGLPYVYWYLGQPTYNTSYTAAGYLITLHEENPVYMIDLDTCVKSENRAELSKCLVLYKPSELSICDDVQFALIKEKEQWDPYIHYNMAGDGNSPTQIQTSSLCLQTDSSVMGGCTLQYDNSNKCLKFNF